MTRLTTKLFVLVLAPLLVLVVLLSAFAWSLRTTAAAAYETSKSIAALRLADRLGETVVDAETGMRGYVLTGDARFLAPYVDAKTALPLRIGLFESFTSGDPATRKQGETVAALALQAFSITDRYVEFVRQGDRARAVRNVARGEGLRSMDDFRMALDGYRKLELNRYQAGTARARSLELGTYALLAAGSIAAVLVTLVLYLTISRTLVKRIKRLEINAALFAAGKPVSLAPIAHDEIDEVENSLQTMFAELQQRHESLARLNVLQRAILDGTDYAIFTTRLDGTLESFNRGAEALLGYRADAVIGRLGAEQFHLPRELEERAALLSTGDESAAGDFDLLVRQRFEHHCEPVEWTWVRADRSLVPVLATIAPLRGSSGETTGYLGVAHDMTERKAAEVAALRHEREQAVFTSQLRSLQAIANAVTTASSDQIDAALLLVMQELGVDSAYLATIEPGGTELVIANSVNRRDTSDAALVPGDRVPLQQQHAQAVLKTKRTIAIADLSAARRFDDIVPGHEGSGSYIAAPVKVSGLLHGLIGFAGAEVRQQPFSQNDLDFVGLTSDLIGAALDRGLQRARIDALASHDELTDLPNRVLLQDRLLQTILRAERYNERFAVLHVDIDDFAGVNEKHGHAQGQRVLKTVAERLASLRRESDTLARLGGDEFMLVASKLGDTASAAGLAERILANLRRPFTLDGVTHEVSASIGIGLFPADGHNAESLLGRADIALAIAKSQGKNRYAFAQNAGEPAIRQRDGARSVRLVS